MKFIFLFLTAAIATSAYAEEYIVRAPHAFHHLSATLQVRQNLPRTRLQVIDLTSQQADELRSQGFSLEPNRPIHLFSTLTSTKTTSPASWHLGAIHAPQAHALANGTGQGQTVCVVDSGIHSTHPEFQNVAIDGIELISGELTGDLSDSNHHGTAVASLIAGRNSGAAPGASLYIVKIFDANGTSSEALAAEGIASCIGKSQVINLSFGGYLESKAMKDAIDNATAAGITVIAAVGNEGDDIAYPARHPSVIAVGSITQDMNIAAYSGRGPELDFVAPGTDVVVADVKGDYIAMSGTSFSAGIASGVEAVRRSRQTPSLKATDLGFSTNEQGQGLINAYLTAE